MEESNGTYDKVKIEDRDGKIFIGVKIREAEDGNGYFVQSYKCPQKAAFITEQTYQAILEGEEVTIHL